MDINAKLNFLATFFGVILSFSLWFLGEHTIKWLAQRKDREAMVIEISEEAKFNILVLKETRETLKKAHNGGDIPLYIPRLRTGASGYAISSGGIRLLKNRRKQFIVRYLNSMYESENSFAENTELLFAVLLLRNDGLKWVKYRLVRYTDGISEKISTLTDFLCQFQQKKLPEDKDFKKWLQTPTT